MIRPSQARNKELAGEVMYEGDFVVDRPYGSGNYLLLLFSSPAFVVLDGVRHELRENSFIIYIIDSPQHYGACGVEYINDYIHFSLNDDERDFFSAHDIPLDRPVYAGSLAEHSELIRSLCFEHTSNAKFSEESIDLQLRLLLIKLSVPVRGQAFQGQMLTIHATIS